MLFEVVKVNDIFKYCEQNNLMLIDEVCTEQMINYGISLFIIGIWLGAAGMVFIISVLVAPDLPNSFGYRDQGMKI